MDRAARQRLTAHLVRLADGDRAAFAPVYAALWPLLHSFCQRALGSDADADDAAQQALVRLFSRAAEFDPARGDALTWALGAAAWECRSARRRAARRREEGEVPELASAHAEEELARRQLLAAAEELLGTLSRGDRATVLAALGEIERPDVAPATFRKRVERAFARLRAAWRSRHELP